jgi:hypothetical protein
MERLKDRPGDGGRRIDMLAVIIKCFDSEAPTVKLIISYRYCAIAFEAMVDFTCVVVYR